MQIRNAEYEDIDWLHEQILWHFRENPQTGFGFGPVPPTRSVFQREAELYIDKGIMLIAGEGGVDIGCVSGVYHTCLSYPDKYCCSLTHWWVQPEHRKGTVAFRLMRAAIRQAKEFDADYVVVSLAKGSDVSENTMRRVGATPAYSLYVMEV